MIPLQHKKIGKYIMLTNKTVAQLRHSAVFMGLNTQNKKKVLIKLIQKSEYESNDLLMNSFNFELEAMNILKDGNILKSIELIITQKNLYLVLEEPQGDSINKTVSKNGPLNQKKLLAYINKLRSTFITLQKHQMIHGNINSKSLLIHHNQVKIGYPSYLKTIEAWKINGLRNKQSLFNQNIEKLREYSYLPPELLSHGQISLKHDIWSLGVVMYEALFGCLPWNIENCKSTLEMVTMIRNCKIFFPQNQMISKEMKHFLAGCLETDQDKRFSWEDVLEHPIFHMDVEPLSQNNQKDQDGIKKQSLQEAQVFLYKDLYQKATSNSTITQ